MAAVLAYAAVGTLRVWPTSAVLKAGVPTRAYYLWAFQHFAYSDIVALYASRDLYTHLWPYVQIPLEYPPALGVFLWLTSWFPSVYGYLVANIVGLTLALVGTVVVARAIGGPERVKAWAFSPLLAIYAIYNWDVLGILTYGLAVWQFGRRRYAWAGFWIGLGISTKLFPVVLLPFMLVALWRERQRGAAYGLLGWTLLTGAAANLPFALLNYRGWAHFWAYNGARGPDPGLWQWMNLHGWISIPEIDAVTLLFVAAGGFWLMAAVWRRQLGPVLAAALLLTWWLLWNKVYSPQYVLWVLYGFVVADGIGSQAWLLNLAGYLDFGLAMVWLALGTGGSPLEPIMGIYVAPVVVFVRQLAFVVTLRGRWAASRVKARVRA